MVFEWLRGTSRQDREHASAIAQLKEQLKKRRSDPRLKLQLAEVLIQAKQPQEAAPLLEAVADDFALQGMGARAIAVLKRLQSLAPGNAAVVEKLAYLISQQENPMPGPWRQKAAERKAEVEIGMEEFTDDAFAIGMEMVGQEAVEPVVPDVSAEPATRGAADPPSAPTGPTSFDLGDEVVRHEFFSLIDMAFLPEAPAASAGVAPSLAASPLFSDFRPDELVEVIRGMKLHVFEPGEILMTQGEPGESLFILASGRARAYVKDAGGRSRQAREMTDGDFFGEIAAMTGLPRTATVTAATRCELLELDRDALARLTQAQPRIRDVLQAFYTKHMSGGR
jgi:hypothetical protein